MTVLALMGASALWLMYLWLASCIIAAPTCPTARATASKPGLATGLCLSAIAIIVWLVVAGEAGVQVEDDRRRSGRGKRRAA